MRCRANPDDALQNVYDADVADAVHNNPFAKGITPVNRRVMNNVLALQISSYMYAHLCSQHHHLYVSMEQFLAGVEASRSQI